MSTRRVAERKKENYCMHLDNLTPLSVNVVQFQSMCVKKKEHKKRRDRVKERGGSFRVFMAFYTLSTVPNQSSPRGPRCSVPLIGLQVIRLKYCPPTKKGEKYCSQEIGFTDQSLLPCLNLASMVFVGAGSLSDHCV